MTDAIAFPGIRWHGSWITTDVPEFAVNPTSLGKDLPPAGYSRVQFRRTLHLAAVPDSAPLRLSADSRYLLWINGVEIGRGPVRSQPRRLRYDEYDVAHALRAGVNAVVVLVTYYGHANSYWQPAASSGLMGRDAQLVLEMRVGDDLIGTDARWRTQRSRAWRGLGTGSGMNGVPIELLDARELDADWVSPGYDDSGWAGATVLTATHDGGFAESRPPVDPYDAMLPRGIAFLGGDREVPISTTVRTAAVVPDLPDHPAQRLIAQMREATVPRPTSLPFDVAPTATAATVLGFDFGHIVAGHVELDVDAPPGVRIDLWYQESAAYDAARGPVDSAPRSSASYTTRGHDDRFSAVDVNGLRQVFVLVPPTHGTVTVREVAVREHRYPWTGDARFTSSDPELERLYRAGIRTTQLNSFDAFTDCPTREQRAWVGDGVVHQMVHLLTNADWRLARHYVALGASPRADGMLPMSVVGEIESNGAYTIPDWALHWIHGVWNLHRYLGDREEILGLLPVVERVLRWYLPYVDERGTLSDVPEWNLIDWSSVFSNGRSSLITGLWTRALGEYADMTEWLGNAASAAWARDLIDAARAGFEDFWDPDRGTYVDHFVDGRRLAPMSQAAGAVAILSGLAPRDRWASVVDVITDPDRLVVRSWIGGLDGGYDMQKIIEQSQGIYRIDWDAHREVVLAEPFFSYVVHDAVAAAGEAARLPDLLRRWSQFLHDGYDTFGECWGWGTPVHAWSSTPTKDLVTHVLGIAPDEPGYAAVRVAPRLGSVERVEAVVPTPHGSIAVDVHLGSVVVSSPVPIRFIALDGTETRSEPGTVTFAL